MIGEGAYKRKFTVLNLYVTRLLYPRCFPAALRVAPVMLVRLYVCFHTE